MKRDSWLVVFGLVILVGLGSTMATAQDVASDVARKQAQANERVTIDGPLVRSVEPGEAASRNNSDGPGITITYDDGIVNSVPAASSFCYGNQFSTAMAIPVTSFSVSKLTFYMIAGAGTDNVFVSVFGAPVGTTAPVLGSASVPLNNGSGAFNTATIGPYAGAGSFMAGVWYIGGDTVGLGTGTTGGQGHHGMVINDIVGTGFATLPGLNALVSATTAVIPVELQQFEVE